MAAHQIATDHLESLIVQHPEFAEQWQKMLDNYQKRLWHQLSVQVREFIEIPEVKDKVQLVPFYRSFIADFASKMNQLIHSHIAVLVSKQLGDPQLRLSFLQEIAAQKYVQEAKDALIIFKATIAQLKCYVSDLEEVKKDLAECETLLSDLMTADTSVHATFHKARTVYFKVKGDAQGFYKSGLQYLAYSKVEKVDKQERLELAIDLGLAALVGEDIYNFGELIQNPVFEVLPGTPFEWLGKVLHAFNSGDIDKWRQYEVEFAQQLNSQPALVANKRLLEQKIAILSVMELVFSKGAGERIIPFETISQVSKLPLNQVELLVMKALSLGLIRGRIDETTKTVFVNWVQPRVLSMSQISTMQHRLEEWSEKVKQSLLLVENHLTPELLT